MPSAEFADEAQSDIRGIVADTIEHWRTAQARVYVSQLRDVCAELARMPGLGKDASWLAPGLRSFPVGSHLVYYHPSRNGILVIAVNHKRHDPERRLKF